MIDSPTLAWIVPEERLPNGWQGRIYIEASEDQPIAYAFPVVEEPYRNLALFAFDCADRDTRIATIQKNTVVSLSLTSLREHAAKLGCPLQIETDCGDELIIANIPDSQRG